MSEKGRVIYSNGSESFLRFLSRFDSFRQSQLLDVEHDLEQRGFFWAKDGDEVVSLGSVSEDLMLVNRMLPGYQGISIVSLSDFPTKKQLEIFIDGREVSPYAYSEPFHELVRELSLSCTESPVSCDVVRWLDSKIGFHHEMRNLSLNIPMVKLPRYEVARSPEDVYEIAETLTDDSNDVVIKVDDGESGLGICFIQGQIDHVLIGEVFSLAEGGIVVEELVDVHNSSHISSPSLEYYIDDGGYSFLYSCGQRLHNGEFLGVSIGIGSLPHELNQRLIKVGDVIASHYHQLGYRGYFDIDYVVSKDLEVYPLETNMRRTGGTHIYDIAMSLFGEKWSESCALLSNDNFTYGEKRVPDIEILNLVKSLYFNQDSGRGVIITFLSSSSPRLGYVAIGRDIADCEQIAKRLQSLFH